MTERVPDYSWVTGASVVGGDVGGKVGPGEGISDSPLYRMEKKMDGWS